MRSSGSHAGKAHGQLAGGGTQGVQLAQRKLWQGEVPVPSLGLSHGKPAPSTHTQDCVPLSPAS